jgi:hypothetical protein
MKISVKYLQSKNWKYNFKLLMNEKKVEIDTLSGLIKAVSPLSNIDLMQRWSRITR